MNDHQIQSIARHIAVSNMAGRHFAPLDDDQKSNDLGDAYEIQTAVYEMLGRDAGLGPLGGHKIALTSPAIQQLVGLNEPIYGSIFASQVFDSPHQINLSRYIRLGLEFEVAIQLAVDLPASREPYSSQTIAPFIQACMPAFELIEDRAADYKQLDAFSLIADRCWCGGAVIGEPVTDIESLDLSDCPGQMRLNGRLIETASTGLAMGHPFNGLAWVANFLHASGRQLKAGELVITGSALKTYFVKPGDEVSYEIGGLGAVSVIVSA